ncbi:MAG TPA: Uma2 family endonuclease [Pyrinomonadaceae bacterium]|nr:Uma2 family endonuclease [Pyrinomonadaceae bacterium]
MSTTSTALMTAEELLQLTDRSFRHELINGELITMPLAGSPHGRIAVRLLAPLAQFVWDHDLGEVYDHSGFQVTVNPDTVLGPDIAFVSKERLREAGEYKGYWPGPPDIAVEVLSPSDRPSRVISHWFGYGVKQLWIVNQKQRTVTVYRSPAEATTFSGSDYLEAQDLLCGFRLSLDRIFSTSIQEK